MIYLQKDDWYIDKNANGVPSKMIIGIPAEKNADIPIVIIPSRR